MARAVHTQLSDLRQQAEDLQKSYDQMKKQAIELEKSNKAKDDFLNVVSHELRTPLAVVRAYADLLAEEPPLTDRSSRDPERRDRRASWHDGTIEQIERLDRLVDSILASVRVVPDQPAIVEATDLEAVVSDVVRGRAPLLGRHELLIEPSVRTRLPPSAPNPAEACSFFHLFGG